MKCKPIKLKNKPGYPTIQDYVENPGLLSKHVPNAWIKNQYAATTLATFILCGNACDAKKAKPETVICEDRISKKSHTDLISKSVFDTLKVAPIFSHGDGAGATGCIVMSPPVFISEDEARKIILEALKVENIQFATTNCPTLAFKAPAIANDCFGDDSAKIPSAEVKIRMDGYNDKYNLAFEYVSAEDYSKFRSDDGCFSSVQGFNTKQAAELIRDEIIKRKKVNSAIFYDPIPSMNFDLDDKRSFEKIEADAKKAAKDQLLAQVTDFIDWLKKSGLLDKK
jgi:hypothetical protein